MNVSDMCPRDSAPPNLSQRDPAMPWLERNIESDLGRLGRDQSACRARLGQSHLPLPVSSRHTLGGKTFQDPRWISCSHFPQSSLSPSPSRLRGQLSLTSLTPLFAPVHSSHKVLHCPQAFLHPTEHLPQPLPYSGTSQPPAASPGLLLRDVVGLLVLSA